MDEQTVFGRTIQFLNALRPCNQAIVAIQDNIKATGELRTSIEKFDSTMEQLGPVLTKIANAIDNETLGN